MLTIDALKQFGADVDEGLERCLNDESFYLMLVPSALEKDNYDKIQEAVESGNLDAAFEAAHALKGVLGNLALTPIYDPVSEMTELLRAKEAQDYGPYLRRMWDARSGLEALVG